MKKPLVIEKRRNQRHKIPAERWGQRNKAVFRLFVFLLFYFVFFDTVSVLSHSAIEERFMVSSRLVRPLEGHRVFRRNRRFGSFWGVFFMTIEC